VTPSFQYDTTRTDTYTGPFKGLFNDNTSTSQITASWLIIDSGFREANYRRSALSRDVSEQTALQTLRTVLFNVHSSFFEAIRSEEIHKVRLTQLERAIEIEKQAKEFAETGAGAKKDVLQATADMLNSRASELAARNGANTSLAFLKAVLGVPERDELGRLVPPQDRPAFMDYSLEDALKDGLENRPDLVAQRIRVEAQQVSVRLTRLEGGLSWSLDAVHTRAFSPDPFDRSALVFQVSIPLYDGSRSKENVRASKLGLDAERAALTQSERNAIAEIESAYKEYAQNIERLEASTIALEAAKINYQAAFDSRQEGAGDLIEVLTAQVSLTTAESNYIEAYYDTLTSRVRLLLVTGKPLPGEGE
jgi:outer membrane protein